MVVGQRALEVTQRLGEDSAQNITQIWLLSTGARCQLSCFWLQGVYILANNFNSPLLPLGILPFSVEENGQNIFIPLFFVRTGGGDE